MRSKHAVAAFTGPTTCAPREEGGFSPVQAVYGTLLNLPADHPDLLNPELPLEQAP